MNRTASTPLQALAIPAAAAALLLVLAGFVSGVDTPTATFQEADAPTSLVSP